MAVTYIRSDLEFILQQILISETHAAGADLTTLIPNAFVPWGLRTVDGSFNNLRPGNEDFGAADELFPRLLDPVYRDDQDGDTFAGVTNTDYGASGNVVDADPRIISNLIVDQTSNNPAAVAIAGSAGIDGIWGTADDQLNDGVSILQGHGRSGQHRRHHGRYCPVLVRQHCDGRGPVRALQPVVRVLRPVLRPRPRPAAEGRQRLRVRSAAARRSAGDAGPGRRRRVGRRGRARPRS